MVVKSLLVRVTNGVIPSVQFTLVHLYIDVLTAEVMSIMVPVDNVSCIFL